MGDVEWKGLIGNLQPMRRFFPLLLLVGCVAGTGGFDNIARQDRDRFTRCKGVMTTHLCPGKGGMYLEDCLNMARASYAEEPGDSRKEWLVANGCPPSMVNPGAHAREEPTDQPIRPTSAKPGQATDEE